MYQSTSASTCKTASCPCDDTDAFGFIAAENSCRPAGGRDMADVERLHALDLDQVSFVRESLQVLRSTVDQQVGTPEGTTCSFGRSASSASLMPACAGAGMWRHRARVCTARGEGGGGVDCQQHVSRACMVRDVEPQAGTLSTCIAGHTGDAAGCIQHAQVYQCLESCGHRTAARGLAVQGWCRAICASQRIDGSKF